MTGQVSALIEPTRTGDLIARPSSIASYASTIPSRTASDGPARFPRSIRTQESMLTLASSAISSRRSPFTRRLPPWEGQPR